MSVGGKKKSQENGEIIEIVHCHMALGEISKARGSKNRTVIGDPEIRRRRGPAE